MVTEAPAATRAAKRTATRTATRTDGVVPGQICLGLETTVTAEEMLEGVRDRRLSLELARKVRAVLGNLPDELPLYTLRFWEPGAREEFVSGLEPRREGYLLDAQRTAEERIERKKQGEMLKRLYQSEPLWRKHLPKLEQEARLREQNFEIIIKSCLDMGNMPIDADAIQDAPEVWKVLMKSLMPREETLL